MTIIQATAQETVFSPFFIQPEAVEKLLLINIEKDPDSTYIGFEPQILNESGKKTFLVIGYRKDEKVDVYHAPGLNLTKEDYSTIGKGANQLSEQEMNDAFLHFDQHGAQLYAAFTDIHNREVILKIEEKNPKKTKPFGLLAPVGSGSENPSKLMLVFMEDFYFVRRSHTNISVSIGGKLHKPDNFGMPIDGLKMYFSRYSPKTIIVNINPQFNDALPQLSVTENKAQNRGNIYDIEYQNERANISYISQSMFGRDVKMSFSPAFPDIRHINEGESAEGEFSVVSHETTGSVSGTYRIEKQNNTILLSMQPTKGWTPYRKNRFIVRFIFSAAKVFRNWPKTYQWNARIIPDETGGFSMDSKWERKK